MTKAVFFDVGNTLLFPHPSVSEVCRQVLLDAGHVRDLNAIDEYMPLVDAYYLGACNITFSFYVRDELAKTLEIPDDRTIIAIVAIGYPDEAQPEPTEHNPDVAVFLD
jgi:FMN phosphatase YigB (HAD superfamily)